MGIKSDIERAYNAGWNDGRKRGQVYSPKCSYSIEERTAYLNGFRDGQNEKIQSYETINKLAQKELI